jgi:hypothetical protein
MFSTLAAALALLTPVHAFWILTHDHALTYERLDPIVNPGVVSPHVHSIIGSDAFAPTMSYPQMQGASSCTTSPVQDDRRCASPLVDALHADRGRSSYWAQSLYHRAANGTFTLIPISFVQTYYLQRAGPTQTNISAFPPGLRMVAGDPYRSTYNASNIPDQAISFVCLNGADPTNNNGPQTAFPQTACPDGLRMQVNFPSCWDGANLDAPDHMAHMAYPEGHPDSGDCPASHPVKTILLFNEYVYDVGAFDFVPGADSWVTATGDATGYSFHADFINGWKESTLAAAVAQCTGALFGNLEGTHAYCTLILCATLTPAARLPAVPRVTQQDHGAHVRARARRRGGRARPARGDPRLQPVHGQARHRHGAVPGHARPRHHGQRRRAHACQRDRAQQRPGQQVLHAPETPRRRGRQAPELCAPALEPPEPLSSAPWRSSVRLRLLRPPSPSARHRAGWQRCIDDTYTACTYTTTAPATYLSVFLGMSM